MDLTKKFNTVISTIAETWNNAKHLSAKERCAFATGSVVNAGISYACLSHWTPSLYNSFTTAMSGNLTIMGYEALVPCLAMVATSLIGVSTAYGSILMAGDSISGRDMLLSSVDKKSPQNNMNIM